MKKLLTSDTAWKVYSILIAVLLWCAVMFTQNPERTRVIKNVPITITNADAIAQAGYYLFPEQKLSVDVRVSGKKVYNVKLKDVSARVTVPNISPGTYSDLPINFMFSSSTVSTTRNDYTITVIVEEKASRKFEIQKEFIGISEAEQLRLRPQLDTETVTLTGPKSAIEKVQSVWVEITKEDIKNRPQKAVVLKDAAGKVIDAAENSITVEEKAVNLTVIELASKELKVEAVTEGNVASGYKVRTVKCVPDEILLGTESNSTAWPEVIKTLPVDLDGQSETFTEEIELQIPEGYELLGKVKTVKVTVEIEQEKNE